MSKLPQHMHFEEEIIRNPYYLKVWWNYLQFAQQSDSDYSLRFRIYERALSHLPRSYKLWHSYLKERVEYTKSKMMLKLQERDKSLIFNNSYLKTINTFERALIHMNKMPRIWIEYCEFCIAIHKGSDTRRLFDRALQSLPITQHSELWKLYMEWAIGFGVHETSIRVYRRFLMFDPSQREEFVEYLESAGQYAEAANQLSICLNDEHFISPSGQTQHQMWMHLCELCSKHPEDIIDTMNVEAIIRSGISRFSDEVGRLWNCLADVYIRLGLFEKARDLFEEAINSVVTVRDFSIVFDAYIKIEESLLTTKMRLLDEVGEDIDLDEETADVNIRLARLEYLMGKRPLMLNSVVLRQNPNNVFEWHKRAKLYKDDTQKKIMTYVEAIKTIDPKFANGKLSGLWMALTKVYENMDDLENARSIFTRATEVDYKTVEELANVWCAWAEMEMRHEEYQNALSVMKQSVTEPTFSIKKRRALTAAQGKGESDDTFEGMQTKDKLFKNVKVWSLYLDLEESLGSVESCCAAYDRAIELKVITGQMMLNYAAYLEEHNFFENSFKVYEKSISLFVYPQLKTIWISYIDKFIERYEGTKLERLRDIFEQAVAKVPSEYAAEFFIKYAKAEEAYGLARHAMAIYDRATKAVPPNQQLDMYRLYVKKVEQYYGVTKTRPVYERALKELNDDDAKAICLEFTETERKLGEIDRARSILQYGSQFADPRRDGNYWKQWREFEEAHGNEDTFREMLRVQRSVEASFSQANYLVSELMAGNFVPSSTAVLANLDDLARQAEEEAIQKAKEGVVATNDMLSLKRKFHE
eukprot:gene8910-12018_t